ncbi:MAG: M13 family metallopeptidase, partial [Bacteroidales bacterium]
MNKLFYLPLIVGVMTTSSCATQQKEKKDTGIDLVNLDTTVSPNSNFYDYATGGWQKSNPLKPEYARFGTFDQLRENNKEQLRLLIEEVSNAAQPQGSVGQKIADLYKAGLDSARLNNEGHAPILSDIEHINSFTDRQQLGRLLGELTKKGISPFFYVYVDVDPGNSSENLMQFYQGGLSMGDRDYYIENDDQTKAIRDAFVEYVTKLFTLAGYSEADATSASESVINTQTLLAKISSSREELRNPVANYNKMSLKDFEAKFKGFNWKDYFSAAGLSAAQELSVGQVTFMQEMGKIVSSLSDKQLKDNLIFALLDVSANYMSDDFETASFDFYQRKMSGKQEQQPRWKRSLETTNSALSEAVGQMYVEKYFPPAAKEKMLKIVDNLEVALGERINNLEWMSDVTKAKAQEKLAAFTVKIGYPDKWRDYTALQIDSVSSYWTNVQNATAFEWDYMVSQLGKPADKAKWHMSPQTVNAYYNPTTNEICFPAAILQPPFFNLAADDAVNYGAIGVVIGHEMTHGFDDQGRQFDKDGNLKDWWTAS